MRVGLGQTGYLDRMDATVTDTDRLDELHRTALRIENKVDKVDDKLDGHAETLARHDIRLGTLERASQRAWERMALWITAGVALLVAVLPHFLS
jgi:hypothetical protein